MDKKHQKYQLDVFKEIEILFKVQYIWYDLLRGEDKKQEWIVQKDDSNTFYFKHADRPNNFMTGKNSELLLYLGATKYGWDVQKFEE